MKTKLKTLFLVILLTLAFSGASYALDAGNGTETDNITLTTSSSASTPPLNSNFSINTTSTTSGYGEYNYSTHDYPITDSADLSPSSKLPSSYDLRTRGKLTLVKDQHPGGTCWVFSSVGSLESCLLPGETWNFSENNIKNILSNLYPEGFDRAYYDGGDMAYVMAYFARWSGPVNASDDPYNTSSGISPEGLTVLKHVQECIFIPPRNDSLNNNLLKEAIIKYGGVVSIMCWNGSYYNEGNCSFYSNEYVEANHAICLVGWDDNYDKNNFQIPAPGNGAFIVKNSWGTNWGDEGYFYISYYDSVLAYLPNNQTYYPINYVFMNAEPTNNYKQIYQYDPFGMVWYTNSSSTGCSTAEFMNVFQAITSNPLTAASFYALEPNTSYELYTIINNVTTLVGKGVLDTAGYKTIKFNQLIPLTAGQEFKIMAKINSPGCNEPIAIEYAEVGVSSKTTSNPGESFIYYDGVWTDLNNTVFSQYPHANVCLKAFTATAADLSLQLEASTLQPVVSELLKFTINVKNNGPDNASSVKVNDKIPNNLEISSYLASFGDYNPVTGIWDIGDVEVGKSVSLTIYSTVKYLGDLINEATISSLTYNLNPVNSTKVMVHAVATIIPLTYNLNPANSKNIMVPAVEYEWVTAGLPDVKSVNSITTGAGKKDFSVIGLMLAALLLIFGFFIRRYYV